MSYCDNRRDCTFCYYEFNNGNLNALEQRKISYLEVKLTNYRFRIYNKDMIYNNDNYLQYVGNNKWKKIFVSTRGNEYGLYQFKAGENDVFTYRIGGVATEIYLDLNSTKIVLDKNDKLVNYRNGNVLLYRGKSYMVFQRTGRDSYQQVGSLALDQSYSYPVGYAEFDYETQDFIIFKHFYNTPDGTYLIAVSRYSLFKG